MTEVKYNNNLTRIITKTLGISKAELSRRINVDVRSIFRWEKQDNPSEPCSKYLKSLSSLCYENNIDPIPLYIVNELPITFLNNIKKKDNLCF